MMRKRETDAYIREAITRMSQEEYRALDVAEFARAHLRRYVEHPGVAEKIYAVAYPDLLRKHLAHLDLVGEERAKLLFGALRWGCNLVGPKALAEEMQHAH